MIYILLSFAIYIHISDCHSNWEYCPQCYNLFSCPFSNNSRLMVVIDCLDSLIHRCQSNSKQKIYGEQEKKYLQLVLIWQHWSRFNGAWVTVLGMLNLWGTVFNRTYSFLALSDSSFRVDKYSNWILDLYLPIGKLFEDLLVLSFVLV